MKKILPLDDTNLATQLLCMCPAKCQTQYDLTQNTTPISTRVLLLVIKNIEDNAEYEYKAQNSTKMKGAEGKCKMESTDSHIPKKPKKVGWTDKHCVHCKKHGGHSRATICMTAIVLVKMALQLKIMGVKVSPSAKKQTLFAPSLSLCKHTPKNE